MYRKFLPFFAPQDDKQGGQPSDPQEALNIEEEKKRKQALEYSQRLNKDKEKIRDEAARAAGFKDYADMQANSLDKRLLENGIQPETGVPIIRDLANDLVSRDPRIIEAERIIAESKEKQITSALAEINTKFGTSFTSVEELDADTKSMIDKGLTPFKAYMANHYDKLSTSATVVVNQKDILDASKQHMKTIPGSDTGGSNEISLSKQQFDSIRKNTGLSMTDEQIIEMLKKNPGIKIPK